MKKCTDFPIFLGGPNGPYSPGLGSSLSLSLSLSIVIFGGAGKIVFDLWFWKPRVLGALSAFVLAPPNLERIRTFNLAG